MKDLVLKGQNIKSKIFTIRSVQVMIDRDLAELYGVLTGNLNKAVKRNIERFLKEFMFQFEKIEFKMISFALFSSSSLGRHIINRLFISFLLLQKRNETKKKRDPNIILSICYCL